MDHVPHAEKPGKVTQILSQLRMGDENAERELFAAVYAELRELAAVMMGRERGDHTLQATALVHEVYLRLMGREDCSWENRAHFFGAACRAMRQVLVDHARRVGSIKRGGGKQRIGLTDLASPASAPASHVLAVDEALTALDQLDARKARLVELRFFGGLNFDEIAEVLDVSVRTVKRDWSFARAWLSRWLEEGNQ